MSENDEGVMKRLSDNGKKPDKSVLKRLPVASWLWPRIAVYIPLLPSLPNAPRVFGRFWAIASQGVPLIDAGYGEIASQRCKAAEHLLESKFTHILMLDHDHEHPLDIVQRMAKCVLDDPRRLVVGGLVFRRTAPYDPALYLRDKTGNYWSSTDWDKGVVEVDALSTACVLIHRSVFETLKRPWFYYDYSGAEEGGKDWVRPTEDLMFCRKVREAGIRIYVDTTTCCPHIASDVPAIDEAFWRRYVEKHGYSGETKRIEEIVKNEESEPIS